MAPQQLLSNLSTGPTHYHMTQFLLLTRKNMSLQTQPRPRPSTRRTTFLFNQARGFFDKKGSPGTADYKPYTGARQNPHGDDGVSTALSPLRVSSATNSGGTSSGPSGTRTTVAAESVPFRSASTARNVPAVTQPGTTASGDISNTKRFSSATARGSGLVMRSTNSGKPIARLMSSRTVVEDVNNLTSETGVAWGRAGGVDGGEDSFGGADGLTVEAYMARKRQAKVRGRTRVWEMLQSVGVLFVGVYQGPEMRN